MNATKIYEEQISAYLERVVRAIRRLENAEATAHGLNSLQLRILQLLAAAQKKLTVGFIADELELSEPTVSDSLRALQAKKLVEKITDAQDRRIKYLQLTPAGRTIASRVAKRLRLPLTHLDPAYLQRLSVDLHHLVGAIFDMSLLHHARICATCIYFVKTRNSAHCQLLRKNLRPADLQTDCPDHAYAKTS